MREKFRKLAVNGKIPSGSYTIDPAECVYDLRLMISTHLDLLDGNSSDRVKAPYKARLERLYKQLNK